MKLHVERTNGLLPHLVQVNETVPVRHLISTEQLYYVDCSFIRFGRQRRIKLYKKRPENIGSNRIRSKAADLYIDIWSKLKELQFPVVPTVRKISPSQIVMTDMCADGSAIFGKHQYMELMNGHPHSNDLQMCQIFQSISFPDVYSEAKSIAYEATEKRIALAQDGIFDLLVRPNGSWRIVFLDPGATLFDASNAGEVNKHNVEYFTFIIERLRSLLPARSNH